MTVRWNIDGNKRNIGTPQGKEQSCGHLITSVSQKKNALSLARFPFKGSGGSERNYGAT